jgi:hypothetical protein
MTVWRGLDALTNGHATTSMEPLFGALSGPSPANQETL